MKKLLIIGHARHGKDTVAEILRDYWNYPFVPASWTFAEEFMTGLLSYDSVEDCFNDRVNHRKLWGDMIAEYNKEYAARGAELIMSKGSYLYVGCRRRKEFDACVGAGLFDKVLWVDRSEHLPPEPVSSMELSKEDADIVVDNNSSLVNLWLSIHGLVKGGHI